MVTAILARRAFAALMLLAFGLPASAREIDLSNSHEASGGQKGIVLMSVSVSGDEPVNYVTATFEIPDEPKSRNVANIGRVMFTSNETFSAGDGRWGRLVALNLYAGEWTLPGTVAAMLTGQGEMRHVAPLGVKFKVVPGQVTYIGNLDLVLSRELRIDPGAVLFTALLGVPAGATSGNPVVHDLRERDLALFKAANPKLDLTKVQVALMEGQRDAAAAANAKRWAARAAAGDVVARAGIASATVFGSQQMPDGTLLRAPAQGVNAKSALDEFVTRGEPERLGLLTAWSAYPKVANRSAPAIDPAQRNQWIVDAAARYSAYATNILRNSRKDESLPVVTSEEMKVWDQRTSLLRNATTGYLDERLARFAPDEVVKAYRADKSKRRVLMATLDRQGHFAGDDGEGSIDTLVDTATARCEAQYKQPCFVLSVGNLDMPSVCPLAMSATGVATQFPPLSLPAVDKDAVKGKAWATAIGDRLWRGNLDVLPRAVVWSNDKARAYAAGGQCGASYAALSECRRDGANQCELVLQDDRITEGTAYGKETAQRLLERAANAH